MECKHERLKSVNCVVYCADCGALLGDSRADDKLLRPKEKPAEAPKKAVKHKSGKEERK